MKKEKKYYNLSYTINRRIDGVVREQEITIVVEKRGEVFFKKDTDEVVYPPLQFKLTLLK